MESLDREEDDAGQVKVEKAGTGGRGGATGWLITIGVIVLLNVLSQVFDWGWIFY